MTRPESESDGNDPGGRDEMLDRSTASLDEYAQSHTRERVPLHGEDAEADTSVDGTADTVDQTPPAAEPPD
ncbi:hypothetical protein [Actinokineospora iranica]|uniref:Uncharacterized protein n=1 Tax=Actinokineospora iranica TaxID=1271860 RepID=A0A1G6RV79_9PSEU|nr:hypothetical protein [Actinokineospora iranica]SDD08468.1 hypothetical protein SAMN05216174_10744 [Actinokineospora iranica]